MACKLSLSYYSTALLRKTEVTYQPPPGKPYQEPRITVKGQNLEAVDDFTYLGSTLSRVVNIDAEVNKRISKASVAFWRLRENVCERRGRSFTTKLKVYRALFLTTLFYACETWTVYSRDAKQLAQPLPRELSPQTPPHQVAGRSLRHGGPGTSRPLQGLHSPAESPSQVGRPCGQNARLLFYGELCHCNRSVGGQTKRYKDCLEASLKDLGVDIST